MRDLHLFSGQNFFDLQKQLCNFFETPLIEGVLFFVKLHTLG